MNLWLVPSAAAHRPGLSYARIDGDALTITVARPELAGKVPLDDLDAARLLVAGLTVDLATVDRGGPCTLDEPVIRAVEGDGIEVRASLTCPGGTTGTYTAGFLGGLEPGHRHYVEAFGQPVAVLDAGHATTAFTGASDRTDVAMRFGKLGVEHILTGYDHLLFLVGLLLAAPGLRPMLFIVTGFTVAHSITLTLAALGVLTLSPALVEPAIAASIVFVGIENFWRPPPRRRVVVTFLLGLVHGFGFAGLLLALGLPTDALTLALVSFNGGVELGQAAVVALVLPLLLWLRRYPWWERVAVPVGSVGVALAGLVWLVERLSG